MRAKRKIKAARIPYRVPEDHELPDRLRPVLAVIYLVHNAGLASPAGPNLSREAIRLAPILQTLMPDEPEVDGLLALLLLTEARRRSRIRADRSLALLSEQNRSQWDRAMIDEGLAIVRRCLERNEPGAYQLQAAINAVHADAATFDQTDWTQILALYNQLLQIAPTPVVALNRAIAIGEVHGAAAALALVDELNLVDYHPYTQLESTYYAASAGPARLRPPTGARLQWHRQSPSVTSSDAAAAPSTIKVQAKPTQATLPDR